MNESTIKPLVWNRRRWWKMCGMVFVAQVGLIFLFASRGPDSSAKSSATEFLKFSSASENKTESLLASSPTLFVLANENGFSGNAWLKTKPASYDLADWTEPPRWLKLDTNRFGQTLAGFIQDNGALTFQVAGKLSSSDELPLLSSSEPVNGKSIFRIAGSLEKRKLLASPELVSWPHSELLSNSVVQVAVSVAGEVISARLVERCGLAAADQKAVEIARTLSFEPIQAASGQATPTWGKIVFEWFTLPLAGTNELNSIQGP